MWGSQNTDNRIQKIQNKNLSDRRDFYQRGLGHLPDVLCQVGRKRMEPQLVSQYSITQRCIIQKNT